MLQIADSSILLQIDIGVVNLYFKGTARPFQKKLVTYQKRTNNQDLLWCFHFQPDIYNA